MSNFHWLRETAMTGSAPASTARRVCSKPRCALAYHDDRFTGLNTHPVLRVAHRCQSFYQSRFGEGQMGW